MSSTKFNKQTILTSRGHAPWYSWPSDRQNQIHFSPANGLPVASYQEFLDCFTADFQITGMDCRGAWPGEADPSESWKWRDHAEDLIAALETQYQQPVIGMGHSLGATILLLAAAKRPDLFEKIIAIDAASVPHPSINLVSRWIPKWLILRMIKPIRGSYQRQRVWESPNAFYENYRSHPTYRRFTEKSLRDYSEYGLSQTADGKYELCYSPTWEAYNFRRTAYIWGTLKTITVPVLMLRAEHSYVYSQAQFEAKIHAAADLVEGQTVMGAHHLVPLERPALLAQQIQAWL